MWKPGFTQLKNILLPLLGAVYPVIFLYSHNAKIVTLSSLVIPLLTVTILAVLLFCIFYMIQRNGVIASFSALVFLLIFHTYGKLYAFLFTLNVVPIRHYTLLPLLILLASYAAFFLGKLKPGAANKFQTLLLSLAGGLVLINLIPVIPVEISKAQAQTIPQSVHAQTSAVKDLPDIYFIIMDEYAGFPALQEYWHYDGYKEFVAFLESHNFYVAEDSHSFSTDSLYEVSSRLNLTQNTHQKDPTAKETEDYRRLFNEISDNKVMRILKSYGYSTVVFDGLRVPYRTKPDIIADYNFNSEDANTGQGITSDEFTSLFFEQTAASAVPFLFPKPDASFDHNREDILYSLEKVEHLEEVPTPKFVYLHLMISHMPMLFDENGRLLDYKNRYDWNYYLGQHKYATKRATQLISDILENSDPARPPVIILQSDHGARDLPIKSSDYVGLENYDDKYKTSILNAVLLPGYDYSSFTKDLSPIEPLADALNYYLHAGVEIEVVGEGK